MRTKLPLPHSVSWVNVGQQSQYVQKCHANCSHTYNVDRIVGASELEDAVEAEDEAVASAQFAQITRKYLKRMNYLRNTTMSWE